MNEDFPKTSTQILKQHFEMTAQENTVPSDRETATPAKNVQVCAFHKRNLYANEKCGSWHSNPLCNLNFYFHHVVAIKNENYKSGGNLWNIGAMGTYSQGPLTIQQVLLLHDKCNWK